MKKHFAFFDLIKTKKIIGDDNFKDYFKNYALSAKFWIENSIWAEEFKETYLDTIDGGGRKPLIKIRIISDSLLLIMESNNTTEVFYKLVFSLYDHLFKKGFRQYCIIANGEDIDYSEEISFNSRTINDYSESIFEIVINPSLLWSNIHNADHLIHGTKVWHTKYFLYSVHNKSDFPSSVEIAEKKDFENILGEKLTCYALNRKIKNH